MTKLEKRSEHMPYVRLRGQGLQYTAHVHVHVHVKITLPSDIAPATSAIGEVPSVHAERQP